MGKVLVGVDGSAAGERALRWASELAAAVGAELIAVRAWTPNQAEVSPDLFEELRAEATQELERDFLAPIQVGGGRVRALVVEEHPDDPAGALLTSAESEQVDLVVVGTEGAGGLAVGSVPHHLAHHVTRPLAVIPHASAGQGAKRVALVLSSDAAGLAAVEFVRTLLAGAAESAVAIATSADEADAALGPLRSAGIPTEVARVESFDAVDAVVQMAEKLRADVLVIGVHALSDVTGVRLGGLAIELVEHAGRAVVLVPSAASDPVTSS